MVKLFYSQESILKIMNHSLVMMRNVQMIVKNLKIKIDIIKKKYSNLDTLIINYKEI